jgi:hypothetical protein
MDEVTPPSQLAKESTKRLYENYLQGKKSLQKLSDEVISRAVESENLVSQIEKDLKDLIKV